MACPTSPGNDIPPLDVSQDLRAALALRLNPYRLLARDSGGAMGTTLANTIVSEVPQALGIRGIGGRQWRRSQRETIATAVLPAAIQDH